MTDERKNDARWTLIVRAGGRYVISLRTARLPCNSRRSAGVGKRCSEGVEREIAVFNNPEDEPAKGLYTSRYLYVYNNIILVLYYNIIIIQTYLYSTVSAYVYTYTVEKHLNCDEYTRLWCCMCVCVIARVSRTWKLDSLYAPPSLFSRSKYSNEFFRYPSQNYIDMQYHIIHLI